MLLYQKTQEGVKTNRISGVVTVDKEKVAQMSLLCPLIIFRNTFF